MPVKFVLVGSGLAGGLLAAYLGRRGYDVDLYERRIDPREGNIVGGRSINLAISTRGIHALEQIGIADAALRHAIPMRGRMIHDKSGALHFAGRRNFQKVYDLPGRVVPAHAKLPRPQGDEHVAWACRTALERLGVASPAHAVFLDDFEGNVVAARNLGMHGILVEDDPRGALAELVALLDRELG